MGFRNLLVHVDATSEGRARLGNALHLARRIGANIIGVGAVAFEPHVDRTRGIFQHTLRRCVDSRIEESAAVFRNATRKVPGANWRACVRRPAQALLDLACGADLIFASRVGETTAPELFATPAELVLGAGTPVLLQPPEARPLDAKVIILAWKNTPASRHAVAGSLPLLKSAEAVFVFQCAPTEEPGTGELPWLEERLRSHGVKVRVIRILPATGSTTENLIKVAEEHAADLIVAGAYSRSRLHECLSRGVTRGLLADSPKYVLFSH